MNGREEMEMKVERKIDEILADCPEIVHDFKIDLDGKTALTKLEYIRHVKEFIEFYDELGKDIYKLRKADINKYMLHIKTKRDGQTASVAIRKQKLASVRKFYDYLIDEELVEKNPCARVSVPTEVNEKGIVYMTVDEVGILKNNIEMMNEENFFAKRRDMAFVTLGCQTGLRCSAIVNINIEDVDLDSLTISVVEKGNKIRTIYLSNETAECIREWIKLRNAEMRKSFGADTNALFIAKGGRRLATRTARNFMKKYSVGISKNISPHKMRSTCGTNVYEKSGDIYLTMEVLGHKNIANTRRYANVSRDKMTNIASIMGDLY